jgi:hypothetical protein
MEAAKDLATRLFSSLGFSVEDIPVRKGRSADLRIADASDRYHLEVKEKFESAEDARVRTESLNSGELFAEEAPLWHDNRISGILRDAGKQLDQTPKTPDTFQLVWFHAHGSDPDLKGRQAFATFYGDVPVSPRWPNHALPTKHCFYFDYSAALAMPSVEALIISERDSLQFCLNVESARTNEFRRTELFKVFQDRNAVFDPLVLETSGELILLRSTIPRKSDDDTAAALKEQTGISYTPIRMKRYAHSALVRLSLESESESL